MASSSSFDPNQLSPELLKDQQSHKIQLPPHLAHKLSMEAEKFGKNLTAEEVQKDLEEHSSRKEAHDQEISDAAAEEVEKARNVAATHKLEETLGAKRDEVEARMKELEELEARLKAAEEKEKELQAKVSK